MLVRAFLDLFEHAGEILVSAENQNSRFGVTPAKVRKHLIERLEIALFARPKLALSDEDVSPIYLDENVGLGPVAL